MEHFEKMLLENKAWAKEKVLREPDYFQRLSVDQNPGVLWIGCSDSRVPAEIVVHAQPGEIFVHRNIANQLITTDFNGLSVLQYAVDVLRVRDVIVCGHYNCGGIRAALQKQNAKLLLVNKWLKHVKDIYRLHEDEIEALGSEEEKARRLVELNVIEQVRNLAHTSIVQQSWRQGRRPILHGWVYGLEDGLIKQLTTVLPGSPVSPIYEYVDFPE